MSVLNAIVPVTARPGTLRIVTTECAERVNFYLEIAGSISLKNLDSKFEITFYK